MWVSRWCVLGGSIEIGFSSRSSSLPVRKNAQTNPHNRKNAQTNPHNRKNAQTNPQTAKAPKRIHTPTVSFLPNSPRNFISAVSSSQLAAHAHMLTCHLTCSHPRLWNEWWNLSFRLLPGAEFARSRALCVVRVGVLVASILSVVFVVLIHGWWLVFGGWWLVVGIWWWLLVVGTFT